jgi:hypothetical protein
MQVVMSRLATGIVLAPGLAALCGQAGAQEAGPRGHYLFAWAGDPAGVGNDFLAVIDADPATRSCTA